jgi:glycogen debranching enzyme
MGVRLHAGYTVLESAADGAVRGAGREGLYDFDTRLLSRLEYRLGDEPMTLVGAWQAGPHRWRARLHAPSPGRTRDISGPALPQDATELQIDRAVGPGLRDELTLTNHSAASLSTVLRVEAQPDFADVQEVGRARRQEGALTLEAQASGLTWTYRARSEGQQLERGVRIRVDGAAQLRATESGLALAIALDPHESAGFVLVVESLVEGRWREPLPEWTDQWLGRWAARRTVIDGRLPGPWEAFERAAVDIGALRNDDLFGGEDRAWFPNAGVPVFTGLFGRDVLTAGWQAGILGPDIVRGAVEVVTRTQAQVDDPWRDSEPGKLIHEVRRGPLSMLELIPRSAYYGTQTTPAMFLLCLSEYWHWTADTRFLRNHLETALRTFDWARRDGDLDGDGFLEYRQRSPLGLKNQGWKDSDEAMRYPDGRVVENPIATVEEQAFHFLALERMAEILVAVGQPDRAEPFLAEARALRRAWDDAFWDPEDGTYAMALDPAKQRVRTVASNPGHALGVGIVPEARARLVADRLMAADLYSGWGIRTLSSMHPSYNPYAYHLGTVWPVEQATFALGFKRYGFDDLADKLVASMLEAATASPEGRLPELTAGVDRAEFPVPVSYPAANSPQAWSASSTLLLLQVTLGLYPFAPLGVLTLVRPRLPPGIPELTVSNLRVGRARVSIRFVRQEDGTAIHEVIDRRGPLLVVEAGPPNAIEMTPRERLTLGALERLPGRRARAARIALGLETQLESKVAAG